MWFLRLCLFVLAVLWASLAWQGIHLIEALVARVDAVETSEVFYVIGVPTIGSLVLAALMAGTWWLHSRKFLGAAAGMGWLSFALLWPYVVILTGGF